MNHKELYQTWAPATGQWTSFAKPALFVHADAFSTFGSVRVAEIPADVSQLKNQETAIIVDLPGIESVQKGLGLAKVGFRPVPLYNGIHEAKIGGLGSVIDNGPIIDALSAGADVLKGISITSDAPPAFLLDRQRMKPGTYSSSWYDNRWSVDFEDFPAASYMRENGIRRVVLWTNAQMSEDLKPILDSYNDVGIQVLIYANDVFENYKDNVDILLPKSRKSEDDFEIRQFVHKFENARTALLVMTIVAVVNLLFMFIIYEPILWTAPSLMWLTYLWIPEGAGDVLAIAMTSLYVISYQASQKKRDWMMFVTVFFGIDLIFFYIYAFVFYGAGAFTDGSFAYGLLVFVPPLVVMAFLVRGVIALNRFRHVTKDSYLLHLDAMDKEMTTVQSGRTPRRYGRLRRRYRRVNSGGYRGFSGYGGTGNGGYSGSGYRGGGYGGGFGG